MVIFENSEHLLEIMENVKKSKADMLIRSTFHQVTINFIFLIESLLDWLSFGPGFSSLNLGQFDDLALVSKNLKKSKHSRDASKFQKKCSS